MKKKNVFFSVFASACLFATAFTISSCGNNDNKPKEEQYKIYELAKESGYQGTYEEWLESVKGADGKDGRPIELSVVDNKIVWKYKGESNWKDIYSINDLIGPKGDKGEDGKDGLSITKIIKSDSNELIDTYTIIYSDGSTSTFVVTNGKDGEDGKQGIQGVPGIDGTTPKVSINKDGYWVINDVVTTIHSQGSKGDQGENGADGKSAYELYLETHPKYKGTLEEWLDDLVNGRLGTEEKIYHTVKFVTGTDAVIPDQQVEHFYKVTKPEDPVKEGYTFDGWYVGNEKWGFAGYSVTEDMTLTAHWSNELGVDHEVMNLAMKHLDLNFLNEGVNEDVKLPETFIDVDLSYEITHLQPNSYISIDELTSTLKVIVPSIGDKINGQIVDENWREQASITAIFRYKGLMDKKEYFVTLIPGTEPKPIEITFWHTMGQENQSLLNRIITDFNNQYGNENIVIKNETKGGYSNLDASIKGSILEEKTPVMAFCYPDYVANYIDMDAVVNLDDLIKETYTSTGKDKISPSYILEDDVNDFVVPFLKEGQQYVKPGTYSMPFSKSTEVMFYNASYLKAHSFVDIYGNPIVPTKWENEADPNDLTALINLCRAIKAKDPSITPLGYDSEDNLFITMCKQLFIPYTSINKEGKASFDFDNPEARAMVEKIKGWYDEGLIKTKGTNAGNSYASTLFTKQKLIFSIDSTGSTKYNKPRQDADGNYEFIAKVAPIPGQKNSGCTIQGPSICFFKNSNISEEQTKAAFEFYKFLTNPENSADYAILTGYEPVRSSSYKTDAYKNHLNTMSSTIYNDVANVTVKLQDDYFTSPAFKGSDSAHLQVGGILTQYLLGTKTLEKAFDDALIYCKAMGNNNITLSSNSKLNRVCLGLDYNVFLEGINSNFNFTNEFEGVQISYEVPAEYKKYMSISQDGKQLIINTPYINDTDENGLVTSSWQKLAVVVATFKYGNYIATKEMPVILRPRVKTLNYQEFIAAKKDDPIAIEVIIDKVAPERKYHSNMVWAHDEAGNSYYIYKVQDQFVNDNQLKAGNKVKIFGVKDIYKGLHQLSNPTEVELLGTGTLLEPKDITQELINAKDLTSSDLIKYQGAPIIVTDLVLTQTPVEGSGKYFLYCTLNGKDIIVVATHGVDDPEGIKTELAKLKPNDILTVTGWGEWYNQFQITIMATDACKVTGTNIVSDLEKITTSKNELTNALPSFVYGEAILPTLNYDDVLVSYTSSNENALKVVGNKFVATPGAIEERVTITAKLNIGTLTETVSKEVVVPATTTSSILLARYSGIGSIVTVIGKITATQGNSFYIDDGESSIFIYSLGTNPYVVGDNVSVSGMVTSYHGLIQVKPDTLNPVHSKITDKDFTPRGTLQVTAENFTKEALVNEVGRMAKATDLVFVGVSAKYESKVQNGYYIFRLGDKTVYLTVERYSNNGQAVANILGSLVAGTKIDVEANLGWYNGPQFDVTEATQITVK